MQSTYEILMKKNPEIVIWGTGKIMRKYIARIDPSINIVFFADTYPHKWGTYPAEQINCAFSKTSCKSKDEIQKNHIVLIAIENDRDIKIVSRELDKKGIGYCHIIDAFHAHMPVYDALHVNMFENSYSKQGQFDVNRIIKFINCHVPYTYCNLRCKYCYISQKREFRYKKNYFHSPEFIRASLSKRRLGGVALINICAGGETLLCKELLPIIKEIVKEGHYVSIITNGTITKAFDDLLTSEINLEHLFIKFSFHYLELKRLNLLKVFTSNVRKMMLSGCSISIEITPHDELIQYIDEIKEFSLHKFGVLPHVTVARNDATSNLQILSKHTKEDYRQIWGTFDSKLFDFKMKQVYEKRVGHCMAGKWSFSMNLESGDIYKCVGHPYLDNIYNDLCREIYLESVGCNCQLPYCYNAHAYLTLGLIKEIKAPSYYEVRDRETSDGTHWVHGKIEEIFKQKLYNNN